MIASLSTSAACKPCMRTPSAVRMVRAQAAEEPKEVTPIASSTQIAPEADAPRTTSIPKAAGVDQQIYRTLAPRVSELRGKQLSAGLSNPLDIFSFYGPLPELLNGRLAMIGFVAAMGAEYVSHETLLSQLSDAPWAIFATFGVIAIASLIPIVRGTKMLDDGAGEGVFRIGSFNVTNEIVNGRAAMLGFAIVAIYEAVAGTPLFTA